MHTHIKKLLVVISSFMIFIPVYTFAQSQSSPGITEPYRQSTVSASLAGKISSIRKKEGEYVKKGATIVELEKAVEALEVERRKLIAESKIELKSAEYQVKTLKLDYEATKKLFETTKSVSEEELWKKELEYKLAEAEHERLTTVEKKEEIEYKIARAQLGKRYVSAPFSGVVVKIHLKIGESCNALEPLVRIVDVHKCRFVTYVEASSSHGLSKNMNVALKIDGGKSPINIQGKVVFVSPVVDPSSGLREVKVVFDNPGGKVKPGISGTMIF